MRNNIVITMVCLLLGIVVSDAEEIDDCLLKVGTPGQIGPMNMHGFYGRVLGCVNLSDAVHPDIFVQSDKWTPGFFLYQYKGRSSEGVPVFGERISVTLPERIQTCSYPGSIVQTENGEVYLIWYDKQRLYLALFDQPSASFVEKRSLAFPETGFEPTAISVSLEEGITRVFAGIPSSEFIAPPGNWRAEDFIPYTKSGIWRGKMNKVGLYEFIFPGLLEQEATESRRLSSTDSEVYMSYKSISKIDLRDNLSDDLITGAYMGVLYYYGREKNSPVCAKKLHLVDASGNAIRHPGIQATPIAYPNAEGRWCDIIATCEGGMYYYRFAGEFSASGKPVYSQAYEVLEEQANLHGGSLPVPTIVDFDGDGVLDLVVGNSQGFINFFKNVGSDESPSFLPGEPVKANGKTIQVQPGYGESVQGPVESRWGYVGPNVIDWDGDGYLDILTNDSRGKHMLYKGIARSGDFRFKKEAPLYCRDLELRGTWRCRPGVGLWNGKMSYITLDDDNEFHLYERIDDQNLEDRGKLRMASGAAIQATYQYSGGTGRIRFEIVDWDGDGVKDLVLGVCKWHSVPDPVNGLPFRQPFEGKAEAGALFMKNSGTEAEPRFEFPEPIAFNGKVIQLGGHEAGVCCGFLGKIQDGKPNLLMVSEQGRFYLFEHKDVSVQQQVIFEEHFSGLTMEHKTGGKFEDDEFDLYFDHKGWTGVEMAKGDATNDAQHPNYVNKPRVGFWSGEAYLTSPAIDLTGNSVVSLSLKAYARQKDGALMDYDKALLLHAPDGVHFSVVDTIKGLNIDFRTFNLSVVNGTANSKIRISRVHPTNNAPNRFFIGSVVIKRKE